MPSEECLRAVLSSSIQAATLARAWALVTKCWTRRSSHSRVECQDSMTALSRADPGRQAVRELPPSDLTGRYGEPQRPVGGLYKAALRASVSGY